MTARTRKWVSLTTLTATLVALDLWILAAAAPHARAMLDRGGLPAALRAGTLATRRLEAAGVRSVTRAGLALFTSVNGWTGGLYSLVLRATPASASAGSSGCCPMTRGSSAATIEDAAGEPDGCQGCCPGKTGVESRSTLERVPSKI